MTLVYFPPGAGGKFLINALGLSPGCVLQHRDLARQQIQGLLTQSDKHHLLLHKIGSTEKWLDLGLGCEQLFGAQAVYTHNTAGYCVNFTDVPESFAWSDVTIDLSQGDLRFFLVAHGYPMLQNQLAVWPRARVILLYNSDAFRRRFRAEKFFGEAWNFWQDVRGQDWPCEPPRTLQDYASLPLAIRQEIHDQHGDGLLPLLGHRAVLDQVARRENQAFDEMCAVHDAFAWDTDWFFDRDKTLQQLEACYQWLGVDGYDAHLLGTLYQHWLEKISALVSTPDHTNGKYRS